MSYQNLDGQQGGYGGYNPYGASAQPNPYGQPAYGQPAYGQSPYGQANNMEAGNGSYEMTQGGNTNNILNKCKEINDGVSELNTKRRGQLAAAQNALLDSATEKEDQTARQTVDYIEDEINNALRYLRDQMKRIKSTPGAGDNRVRNQVDHASRKLQNEVQEYQRHQVEFDKRLREQVRRRYAIANPDASAEDIEQGVELVVQGQEQTFQVTGARTRQANDARRAALERSAAIRKIEKDLIELAELYQEIGEIVHQQEPAVEQIDQGAQDVVTNVTNANTQIDGAIQSAKNARKWKWYALLIVILIIAIVVGVAVGVTQGQQKAAQSASNN